MDGVGYFKRLRYIVLPMIAGVLIVALLILPMDVIRYFDIIPTRRTLAARRTHEDRPDPSV